MWKVTDIGAITTTKNIYINLQIQYYVSKKARSRACRTGGISGGYR